MPATTAPHAFPSSVFLSRLKAWFKAREHKPFFFLLPPRVWTNPASLFLDYVLVGSRDGPADCWTRGAFQSGRKVYFHLSRCCLTSESRLPPLVADVGVVRRGVGILVWAAPPGVLVPVCEEPLGVRCRVADGVRRWLR